MAKSSGESFKGHENFFAVCPKAALRLDDATNCTNGEPNCSRLGPLGLQLRRASEAAEKRLLKK